MRCIRRSLLAVLLVKLFLAGTLQAQVPAGFKRIFNGINTKGWHISRTTHQGTTPSVQVRQGALVLTQQPFGQGGVLLTNKQYKNFELYLEAKIDSFTNGGIFIRSSESGIAYQIELDEAAGSTGSLLGERMPVSTPARAAARGQVWKANSWNTVRIRMAGDIPHITLWINGVQVWDVIQTRNDFIAGATRGFIGLQVHWTTLYSPAVVGWNVLDSWAPGAVHQFRNIAIKKLADNLQH